MSPAVQHVTYASLVQWCNMSPAVQHVTYASLVQWCNLTPEVRYVNEQSSIIHTSTTYYYQTYQTPTPGVHVCMFTSVFDMRRMFTKLSVICAACSLERLLCAVYLPMHVLFVLHFSKGLFEFCACPTTEGVCCKFATYASTYAISYQHCMFTQTVHFVVLCSHLHVH